MRISLFTFIAFFTIHHSAAGHAMAVHWKLQGDKVIVTVFFDDDLPAEGVKVTVRDAAKKVILTGTTDSEGKWTFAAPKTGAYQLHAVAGDGHAATQNMIISATPPGQVQSGGPERSEFTQFPLAKIIIGFGIIGGLTIAAMIAYRVNRHKSSPPGNVNVNNSPSA